ncbi:MAG: hypothetical protein ACTSQU_16860 [Promethearchaeota archaeon]
MKSKFLCYGCGYKKTLINRELDECPWCKSTSIEIVSYSKYKRTTSSSGGGTEVMLKIIFGIIGVFLFIFGLILLLVDVGLPGIDLPTSVVVLHLNPLSITFLIIGVILLVIVSSGSCIECCIY